MIKYPKIGQFRNVVKSVRDRAKFKGLDDDGNATFYPDHEIEYPVIEFTGTVKLHGTNASVAYNDESGYWAQARNRTITIDNDNAGFAFFVESLGKETLDKMFSGVVGQVDTSENTVIIYGEYCGGNIQKGVAINGLDKMFVIFGVKVRPHDSDKPSHWLKVEECGLDNEFHPNIHHITKFGTWTKTIDFGDPAAVQNELVDITLQVEKECPAGKYFGRVAGEDNTTGEGIVWSATTIEVKMYNGEAIINGKKASKELSNELCEKLDDGNYFFTV